MLPHDRCAPPPSQAHAVRRALWVLGMGMGVWALALAGPGTARAAERATGLDINQASEADLDGLRGVGPALTARILAQRAQAPFADWADLQRRVKGIRPTTARRLAEQGLTVGGQQPTSQPDRSSGEKRDSAAAQALQK